MHASNSNSGSHSTTSSNVGPGVFESFRSRRSMMDLGQSRGQSPSGSEAAQTEADDDSDAAASSSSREMFCTGCDISSKSPCPVAKKMNKHDKKGAKKVQWGKVTTRTVEKQNKTDNNDVKVRCGSWCALCVRILAKRLKTDVYAKLLKNTDGGQQ